MFRLNVYKTRSISEDVKKKTENNNNTKKSNRMFCHYHTLFKSFVSLSMKLDDNCETTGRNTAVNGSN